MRRKAPNGFTLIELMIVLAIGSTLLAVATIYFQKSYQTKEMRLFLEKLERDLYYTQRLALQSESPVYLQWRDTEHRYVIGSSQWTVYKEVKMPSHVKVVASTLPSTQVVYNSRGNISAAGTLLISSEHQRYKLVFLLGKGRFYLEKL
ncbi:ComG operon protein 4 [Fictibacillus macauensis ZFHKF-1]|uniref:ComG operon protein 4 n=1 Tax=Fictibacillus macauensis ZFHKF-1 TaxID=1196324 RepID=I8UC66_9BACL|nr:competence type IV pilus minor pilin ComGD [Fictibacillus macauensis]EIT84490.1 ComG operon protein 4 [Fictibacillus macauensis ZFHKF-1]